MSEIFCSFLSKDPLWKKGFTRDAFKIAGLVTKKVINSKDANLK